jgi:hypothetical protein
MFRSWFNLSSIKYVFPLLKVTLGSFLGPLLVFVSGVFIIFRTSWSESKAPSLRKKSKGAAGYWGLQGDVIPPATGGSRGVSTTPLPCASVSKHTPERTRDCISNQRQPINGWSVSCVNISLTSLSAPLPFLSNNPIEPVPIGRVGGSPVVTLFNLSCQPF